MVPKAMKLQTAKEMLGEVFGARPGEVEEMIQRWLVGRSRPETFCLVGAAVGGGSSEQEWRKKGLVLLGSLS
jgi:hypothetical protein